MKKLSSLLVIMMFSFLQAQIGVKAGLTFNNDDGVLKSFNKAYQQRGENNMGYHIGIFKEFSLFGYYIEPELQYVAYKKEYQPASGHSFDVNYKRIDVPVSIGKKFISLFKLQAGPVLSYYFEDKIKWENVSDIQQDDIAIGLQIGAGIELQKLHVDLRYDFPLSDHQTDFIKEKDLKFQTEDTPKLFHISLGYEL